MEIKTKNITEPSDPESPYGSPIDSENEFNQKKVD
jgi:hypothetical protein